MNNLIKRADKKVGSKGSAESTEERRIASFLKGFHKQNLRLFYWLSILFFSSCCTFWGVECLIYWPSTKNKQTRGLVIWVANPQTLFKQYLCIFNTKKVNSLSLTFWPCCILGPNAALAVAQLSEIYPPRWATTDPSPPEAFYNLSPSICEERYGTWINYQESTSSLNTS